MITIKYYGMLIKKTKVNEENMSSKNLKELLKQLKFKYGEDVYKHAKMSYILINNKNASALNGYKTKLKDGDVVQFLPVCGGG